uniref:Uncharacterized protein n=1 Tax=Solanum tuberosum TaxID=4113 RepID=M1A3I6_SOLTU
MAETVSPQPRAVDETPEKPSYASISNPSTYTKKFDGKLPLKLKPVIYVHGEPTVSFNFLDLESYNQEENLEYALIDKFFYGRPDIIDLRKSFTRHFAIKGDCNLGLLDHVLFDVLRDEKFGQYEGLHVTDELSVEFGNTLDLDKQIEQTGKLKQCCHDEHTNQQALVTHEKEFIVTEKINGKEINPNTPTMFILDQEVATNNLNESKEKRRGGGE